MSVTLTIRKNFNAKSVIRHNLTDYGQFQDKIMYIYLVTFIVNIFKLLTNATGKQYYSDSNKMANIWLQIFCRSPHNELHTRTVN